LGYLAHGQHVAIAVLADGPCNDALCKHLQNRTKWSNGNASERTGYG